MYSNTWIVPSELLTRIYFAGSNITWETIICWSGRGKRSTKESCILSDLLCDATQQGRDIFAFTYGVSTYFYFSMFGLDWPQ